MVDYTDSQIRRFLGSSSYRTRRFNGLLDNEVSSICKYLENPTRSGFWVLELNLNTEGEFKEFLKKQLSYQLLSEEKVVVDYTQSGEPQSTLPGLSEFDENNL